MIVGHTAPRYLLEASLPDVTLITGPRSVGKRTLAEHAVRFHGVLPADLIFISHVDAGTARSIIATAQTWSQGPFKAIIARLDGASDSALNILLKVLEEPPGSLKFLLLATEPTLPTIISRAVVLRCGLLTDQQVAAVLKQGGMAADQAVRLAPLGRGHVLEAMDADAMGSVRSMALAAIKAVANRDMDALTRTLSRWDDLAQEMLIVWAQEAACGRWRLFSAAESYGLDKPEFARTLLAALSTAPGAGSRLKAINVLEAACLRR